jgi:pimeloyl-ACP methyl ester carboxylesterase
MAVDIDPDTASNRVAAEQFIAPAVSRLLDRANSASRNAGAARPIKRVDLVGHSMGAFSSRWYAAMVAPERVRTWISVAGSNHGTAALCDYDDPGAREMCPPFAESGDESEIQVKLNGTRDRPGDETPFGLGPDPEGRESVAADGTREILYLTLRLEPDRWIVPSRSAIVQGAGGIDIEVPAGIDAVASPAGNYLLRGPYDHMSILASKEVFELIRVFLTSRDP